VINAESGKKLLDDAVAEAQAKRDVGPWLRVVNSILVDLLEVRDKHHATLVSHKAAIVALTGKLKELFTGAPAGATPAASQPAVGRPPAPTNGGGKPVRTGANGEPLSPEEQAREEAMDAACEGMAPHPGAG
jgi:hypothetical protein